jgi:hypothetical protein
MIAVALASLLTEDAIMVRSNIWPAEREQVRPPG